MGEIEQLIAEYEEKARFYARMAAELKARADQSSDAPIAKDKAASSADADYLSRVKENEFFNKSQAEAAKLFLERIGHPMKTQQILEAINRGGVTVGGKNPQTKKQNFYTILFRSSDFVLFKRDTWALIAWPGMKKLKE